MNHADELARKTMGKTLSLLDEFKAFALKGNVVDLAIGVIIGGAFGKIVAAMVDKILMPIALWPLQRTGDAQDLTKGLAWQLGSEKNVLDLGGFINEIVSFLIVSAALFFFIVKFLGWIMKNKKAEVAETPPPTKDQELLTEIRDLLKQCASPT
jgi:large conductance mechanosensitive channel